MELANIPGEMDSFFGLKSHISKYGLSVAVGAQSFDGNGVNRRLARVFDIEDLVFSINDVRRKNLTILPNPTSGIINITTQNNDPLEAVIVYNTIGQSLLTFATETIDLSGLSKGL